MAPSPIRNILPNISSCECTMHSSFYDDQSFENWLFEKEKKSLRLSLPEMQGRGAYPAGTASRLTNEVGREGAKHTWKQQEPQHLGFWSIFL